MDMLEMKAVVSEVTVGGRYRGFPIAYFSEHPVGQEDLHRSWARQQWRLCNDDGEVIAGRSRCDHWSFNASISARRPRPVAPTERRHADASNGGWFSLRERRRSLHAAAYAERQDDGVLPVRRTE